MSFKAIQIALSPNNKWKDTLSAFWQIIYPLNWFFWKRGKARINLTEYFKKEFQFKNVYPMANGRDGLYLILKSLNLQPGSEIIVQAFTCMVVVNEILWNGLTPIYIDIDERNLNLNIKLLEGKISKKTKVVILQYTFGMNTNIKKVMEICKKHNLILIEDCAHTIGGKYHEDWLGGFGDFSFFSFGRSKAISSVSGGMVICNNDNLKTNLEMEYSKLAEVNSLSIFRTLMHPLICSIAKFFYGIGKMGQMIMIVSQFLGILSMEVSFNEKMSNVPRFPSRKLPNAMAKLALIQLTFVENFNKHRKDLTEFYNKNLIDLKNIKLFEVSEGNFLLRYPLLVSNPQKMLNNLKLQKIYLGNWYKTPIAPPDIDNSKTGYIKGSCPKAENCCKKIINLPLQYGITLKDAQKIIISLKNEIS